MKRSVILPILAAVLAIGALLTVVSVVNKRTQSGGGSPVVIPGESTAPDSGTAEQPAEKLKSVLSNYSEDIHYGYRESNDQIIFCVYSSALKPNTEYRMVFNYYESDHQTVVDQYGLAFKYAYDVSMPGQGSTLGQNLFITDGQGMKPGYGYSFETNSEGFLIMYLLEGTKTEFNSTQATIKAIVDYMKANFAFMIYEVEA